MEIFGGINPEIEKQGRDSTLLDYFNVVNPAAMRVLHSDLFDADRDDSFVLNDHVDFVSQQTDEVQRNLMAEPPRSYEDMLDRVGRINKFNESAQAIGQDSLLTSIPLMLGVGLTDPTNLIPIGGAVGYATRMGRTANRALNVGKAVGITAAAGAAGAVASEGLYDVQNLPTDYSNAALFGMALGGTLGGIGEALIKAPPGFRKIAAGKIMSEDDALAFKDFKVSLEPEASPIFTSKVTDDVQEFIKNESIEKATRTGERISTMLPKFMRSNVMTAYASADKGVRDIASRITRPQHGKGQFSGDTMRTYASRLNGKSNEALTELAVLYKEQVRAGYKGTKDDFYNELGTQYKQLASQQDMAVRGDQDFIQLRKTYEKETAKSDRKYNKDISVLKEEIKKNKKDAAFVEQAKLRLDDLEKERSLVKQKLLEERYKNEDVIWKKHFPSNKITKLNSPVHKYFQEILKEAKGAEMPELKNISENRLYMPRHLNSSKIKELSQDKAKSMIERALVTHPNNQALRDDKLLLEEAVNEYWSRAANSAFGADNLQYMLGKEKFGVDTALQGRKIYLNEAELTDMLETDISSSIGQYHYWMRGQIAARQALPELRGVESSKTMEVFRENFTDPIRSRLASSSPETRKLLEDDLVAVDEMMQDIMGTLRIAQTQNSALWKGTRVATQVNSITMGGMFGIIQALEIPAALWATGFNRVFHKQFGALFGETVRTLGSKKFTPLQKELVQMGYLAQLTDQMGVNRIADTEGAFNVGKLENKLMGFSNKVFAFNGMRVMTSWLETMVASNIVTKFKDINPKALNPEDAELFLRWGINESDAKHLQEQILKHSDISDDGIVKAINFKAFDSRGEILMQRAISEGVASGVIQGDTWAVPTWMKNYANNPFVKLMTQFWRYPLAANEQLLAKGINSDRAGLAATTVAASMMSMGMFYLIEQAELASGAREASETFYDISTEEGMYNLVLKGLSFSGTLSGSTIPLDVMGSLFIEGEVPWSPYRTGTPESLVLGASGQILKDVKNITSSLVKGEYDNEDLWDSVWNRMPLHNFIVINPAVQELIEDNTRKY